MLNGSKGATPTPVAPVPAPIPAPMDILSGRQTPLQPGIIPNGNLAQQEFFFPPSPQANNGMSSILGQPRIGSEPGMAGANTLTPQNDPRRDAINRLSQLSQGQNAPSAPQLAPMAPAQQNDGLAQYIALMGSMSPRGVRNNGR